MALALAQGLLAAGEAQLWLLLPFVAALLALPLAPASAAAPLPARLRRQPSSGALMALHLGTAALLHGLTGAAQGAAVRPGGAGLLLGLLQRMSPRCPVCMVHVGVVQAALCLAGQPALPLLDSLLALLIACAAAASSRVQPGAALLVACVGWAAAAAACVLWEKRAQVQAQAALQPRPAASDV